MQTGKLSPAFEKGQEDFYNGKTLLNNPHTYDTKEYRDWEQGWLDSYGDELELNGEFSDD